MRVQERFDNISGYFLVVVVVFCPFCTDVFFSSFNDSFSGEEHADRRWGGAERKLNYLHQIVFSLEERAFTGVLNWAFIHNFTSTSIL